MLAAGVTAGAIGAAVLVGWRLHSIRLIQVVPTAVPTQRMTALAFLLCGIALVLAGYGRRRAAAVCAVFVLLGTILVCLEYALNTRFGIDELLGPDYILVRVSHPGRMSPVSALLLLVGSLVVLAMARRLPARLASAAAGITASALLAVGIVGILGYILGRTETFGWGQLNRVGLAASAAFASLGAGLMAWAWQERETAGGAPGWLPVSIGLGLAAGALGVWQALLARPSKLAEVSGIMLAGSLLGALLVAVAVAQTLRAYQRSRELQVSGVMLQQLFRTSPDGLLIVDRQGTLVRANRRAEAIFGYAPRELLGSPVERLFPEGLHELGRSQQQPSSASPSPQPMERAVETYGSRKDGSQFPAEVLVITLGSADATPRIVVAVRDITARQEALHLSEERFRSMFEQEAVGVMLIGTDYRMSKVNPALCRMLGRSEEELTRMTPLDITHPEDRDPSLNLMEHLFTGKIEISKVEKRFLRKTGQTMWGSLSVGVIRDREGNPLYGVGMVEDITEHKHAQAELRLGNEIIAKMEEALCLVRTSDGILVYVNPRFEKMFGYEPGELVGKHVARLNAPTDKTPKEIALEIMAQLIREGVWRGEILNCRKDGTCFRTSATVSTFDHPDFGKVWISIQEDITARKQAEQTLQNQAALLDLAHDAIFVRDLENKVTFWNRGATDAYGWSEEEARGRVSHQLLQTKFPVPFPEIMGTLETQGEWEGELEHTRKDGKTIVVDSRWSLQRDESGVPRAVLEINRDVTARKRAEEQLRNLMERLSLSTKTPSIGTWDLDLRTHQAVWDDTHFEIFGMPKVSPLAYEVVLRRIHPDDRAAVEACVDRAIRGKTQEFVEFRVIRPDGSVRHVSSAAGVVLDEQGDVVRLVGTAVDISVRKEMEAQVEASKAQMVASARLSALGMMAGGVAHEINNPLSIIHASSEDLLRRVKEEGAVPLEIVARNGERILQTANRITKIVKSMRHLAREGSQDRKRPTLVSKIVEEPLEVCKERFKDHAVRLHLPDIDPAWTVCCREVQIGQVLLNLLQNAFDAVMEQPGERWIRLKVIMVDEAVEFSVTDSGPGIPPELKNKILEPFFTTKEVGKGTGLGLSLSRKIVEEHGSTLEIGEQAGYASFSFRLPMSRKEELVCS
jgi:PAS domain S-box-containing protein